MNQYTRYPKFSGRSENVAGNILAHENVGFGRSSILLIGEVEIIAELKDMSKTVQQVNAIALLEKYSKVAFNITAEQVITDCISGKTNTSLASVARLSEELSKLNNKSFTATKIEEILRIAHNVTGETKSYPIITSKQALNAIRGIYAFLGGIEELDNAESTAVNAIEALNKQHAEDIASMKKAKLSEDLIKRAEEAYAAKLSEEMTKFTRAVAKKTNAHDKTRGDRQVIADLIVRGFKSLPKYAESHPISIYLNSEAFNRIIVEEKDKADPKYKDIIADKQGMKLDVVQENLATAGIEKYLTASQIDRWVERGVISVKDDKISVNKLTSADKAKIINKYFK